MWHLMYNDEYADFDFGTIREAEEYMQEFFKMCDDLADFMRFNPYVTDDYENDFWYPGELADEWELERLDLEKQAEAANHA